MKLSSITGTKSDNPIQEYDNSVFDIDGIGTYKIEKVNIDLKSETIIIGFVKGKKTDTQVFEPTGKPEKVTLKNVNGGLSKINEYINVPDDGKITLIHPIHDECTVYKDNNTIEYNKISNITIKLDKKYKNEKFLVRYNTLIKNDTSFTDFMNGICHKNTFNYNMISYVKNIIYKRKTIAN